MRNDYLYKKYKQVHNCCEQCGERIGLEVHHKIPIVKGGTDAEDNLIVLCYECHAKSHRSDRSELTKIGMQKAKNKIVTDVWISKIDLLQKIHDAQPYAMDEIIDLIIDAPAKKYILE